jgi:hypothetical protein
MRRTVAAVVVAIGAVVLYWFMTDPAPTKACIDAITKPCVDVGMDAIRQAVASCSNLGQKAHTP